MTIKCPECNTGEFLKKILYGMPSEDFDFKSFHVGGCIPSQATLHCSKCDWEDSLSISGENE